MTPPRLCLVVADAARARLYSFDGAEGRPSRQLREWTDLVNPARRLRPSEIDSDTPGVGHAGGVGYGLGDHRDEAQHEVDRRFAREIGKHLTMLLDETGDRRVVIVASPHMLGLLRTEVPLAAAVERTELARDLTRETTPQLHEHLAELGVLPAPQRIPAT